MPGFGTSPFGTSVMGIGAPADPSTIPDGTTSVSRYVGPVSGDYEVNPAGGQLRQMSGVLQRVVLTIRTELGSVLAATKFGRRFPRKQTSSLEAEVAGELRRVLRPLTDVERVMVIESIGVQRGDGGRVGIDLRFTNLQTGASEQIPDTLWL